MSRIKHFLYNYRNAILAWIIMALLIVIGVSLGVDETLIGIAVVLVGLLGQAFAALLAWIGLVPLIGPFIAKVLALPFFWILNGIGYLASIVAIRQGFTRDVLNYRILTIVLLVGVTIGYILGKLI
ncbi:MAG: hypothetical protein FJ215_10830 [Ignavibacteria bacterium]|nr:hypothetical protein [Ignavibacteria bacterium]